MGGENLAIIDVPWQVGKLLDIKNVPIVVAENEAFEGAITLRDQLLQAGERFKAKIASDDDYNAAMQLIPTLKKFKKFVGDGIDPVNDEINTAKKLVMDARHKLEDSIDMLIRSVSQATGAYKIWKDEQTRLENERRLREAELDRQRKQRAAEIDALIVEIGNARQEADAAVNRGQPATKDEILAGIKWVTDALKSSVTTDQITNPVDAAYKVKQTVVLAVQHEQARIAAAAAKAEGDKKMAAQILKASAKLEAPEVEEVYVVPVQAAPTVVVNTNLGHVAGAHVGQAWRVKTVLQGRTEKVIGIRDPERVCREHPEVCEPSVSKLNELAKRLKTKPNIPGVEWELDTRTKGVRS